MPYDAIVLLSYGGPDKPEDVVPFLRNATGGRGIPDERLEQVGEHYYMFGGKSPINELNAELLENLRDELARRGHALPMAVGNRNWHPFGGDILKKMYDDGARRILTLSTSAYSSYSSCRQYREDIARWEDELALPDLVVEKLAPYWGTTGFFEATRSVVARALAAAADGARLIYVTHSIPTAMDEGSGRALQLTYDQQHRALADRVSRDLGVAEWDLAYCSRSGSPHTPWLEPDICDHLEELAGRGVTDVVLAPIGFISDHMEVLYDLDTEAKAKADELDLGFTRAATVGREPEFISQLGELIALQLENDTSSPEGGMCSAQCCWAGPNPPTVRAAGDAGVPAKEMS